MEFQSGLTHSLFTLLAITRGHLLSDPLQRIPSQSSRVRSPRRKHHARPSFYLLPPERLLDAATLPTWLGRVVKSYSEPDANFVPDDPTPYVKSPLVTTTIANASLAASSQRHKALAAALGASTIHASREANIGGGLSFTSSEIICVRLQNHDAVFDNLIQKEETRSQLQKMLSRGGNAGFMVTAVLIWRDAIFTHSRERGVEATAGASIPISTVLSATAGITVPSELSDPVISGSQGRQDMAELSGESSGSHIFALQYKTVRRSVLQLFGNGMTLKESGPKLPASHSFAKQEGQGDDFEEEGNGNYTTRDAKSNNDDEGNDRRVALEIDEDQDITWADVLDEDEEDVQLVDITLDGEEIQFVF